MSNFKKFCFFQQQKKIYCSKNARIPLNLGGAEFLQKFTVYVFANQILLLRFFCGYTPKLGGGLNSYKSLGYANRPRLLYLYILIYRLG